MKYKKAELKRFLSHVRPKAILSLARTQDFDLESALESVIQDLESEDTIALYMVGKTSIGQPFDTLYMLDPEQRTRLLECKARQKPDDGLLVIFTGGTTGVPKSAMLSKENVTAMAEAEARILANSMKGIGIKGRIKSLAYLPPSHVGGSVEMICSAITAGNEIIIHDTWSPKRFLETIEKESIPWIGGVPTMYAIILLLPELDSYDLSSLKLAILSGEKVKLDLLNQIKSRICPNIMIGYGSTEAGSEISFTRLDDPLEKIASGTDCRSRRQSSAGRRKRRSPGPGKAYHQFLF
ncbi:MAG: AMP-binding protein [Desulfobacter sp.]|nr:AMP-binding protein [Desulfobacter sp.]